MITNLHRTAWVRALSVVAALTVSQGAAWALTIPIDLNDFTADPASAVTIAPDGSSADFVEDPVTSTDLSNTALTIPGDAMLFLFEYTLTVQPDEQNYLDFYLAEMASPAYTDGGGEGTYSGTVSMDLVPHRGTDIPVLFSLGCGFGDLYFDSTMTIRDVRIQTRGEDLPAGGNTFVLLVVAACSLRLFRRT